MLAVGCGGADRAPSAPEWRSLAPATLARTEVAAARVWRFIYVIGGFERATGAASTAEVERYDVERDRWTRVAAMPVALNHAAATAYRCDVYVVGGYRGDRSVAPEIRTLYRYDPERDRWRRLPPAPTKRAGGRRDRSPPLRRGRRELARGRVRDARDLRLPEPPLADRSRHGGRARAPRRCGRGRPLPRARRARRRPRQSCLASLVTARGFATSRRRRSVRPADAPLAPPPSMAKPRGGFGAAAVGGRIVVAGGEEEAGMIREVEASTRGRAAGAGSPTCRRRATGSAWCRGARSPTRSRAATGRASRSRPR